MKGQKPCGSWESQITAEVIANEQRHISELVVYGDYLFWLEKQQNGITVLMRGKLKNSNDPSKNKPNLEIEEILPRGQFDVRNKVYEYGGGSYCVKDDVVYFTNLKD